MDHEITDDQCPVCYLDYTDTLDKNKVTVCSSEHGLCKTCYITIVRNDTQKKCPMCRTTMFTLNFPSSQRRPIQPRRRHRCGECRQEGHNRTTCPHLAHVREYERQRELQRQEQLRSNICLFCEVVVVAAVVVELFQLGTRL